MRSTLTKAFVLSIALKALLLSTVTLAEIENEQKVKAAIVYKILRYVSWPEHLVNDQTIRLCIHANDPYKTAFAAVDGRQVNARQIKLVNIENSIADSHCQVIFASSALDFSLLSGSLNSSHAALTISDQSAFAENGGMINLVIKNNRVRFKINPGAAEQSNIRISSALLKLADIVSTRNRDKPASISLHADSEGDR